MDTFAGSQYGFIAGVGFTLLLVLVCISDLRTRRIPNRLVVWIMVLGLAYSVGAYPWASGLARAVGGLLVGFVIWFPFYLLRMLGAGDVKFFAAASAWLGVAVALQAAALGALVGAVLAVVWMVRVDGWRLVLVRLAAGSVGAGRTAGEERLEPQQRSATRRVPYGVAMAVGLGVSAWLPHLLR
jgi:prepilin peptidase CpaA